VDDLRSRLAEHARQFQDLADGKVALATPNPVGWGFLAQDLTLAAELVPDPVLFVDHAGVTHTLTVTRDESTGTVWVPVWLVADNPTALGWIADLGLPSGDDYQGGPSVYRVPRWNWYPRMGI